MDESRKGDATRLEITSCRRKGSIVKSRVGYAPKNVLSFITAVSGTAHLLLL